MRMLIMRITAILSTRIITITMTETIKINTK